ncbi:MAG: rod shape-determining protein MreC [Panacagrimonas sp.]
MNTLGVEENRSAQGLGLGLKALVFLMVCGSLMAADTQDDRLDTARGWIQQATQPLVWVAQLPTRFDALLEHLAWRESLLRENRELRRKQMLLEAQLNKLNALEAENRRVRGLLNAVPALRDRVMLSEILSTNQDPYRQQLSLDKGRRHEVHRGQAVVDAHGLLGQVIDVNPETATALLISDPDHGVPVQLSRTGLQAIALGQGRHRALRIPHLPGNADIKKGDLFVTSGLGGRFPNGYPVATVAGIRRTPTGHFIEAIAQPTAKLGHGRQVLLVWSAQTPADEAGLAEAAATEAAAHAISAPSSDGRR